MTPSDADKVRHRRQQEARPTSPQVSRAHDAQDLPDFLTGQFDVHPRDENQELEGVDAEMLATLIELGVSHDSARRAILEDRVALLLSRQVLHDEDKFTLAELAQAADLPMETLQLMRRATGLPEQDGFGKLDLEWAKQAAELLEVFTLETAVRSARARGNALMAIVNGDMSIVRDELILPLRRAGADDITIGLALAEATKAIDPVSRALLLSTYGLLLRHMLSTEIAATAVRGATTDVRLAVGFVDIVGYTRLSARIDPSGLDSLIDDFERRVVDVVSARREVAVVKYLGDAVMLVAPDALTLADAMLELSTEVESLAESPVRGGMAVGQVIARDGDFFGPTVNLAARLTDIARPWRVLVAEDDIVDTRTKFRVERVRPLRLRGIGVSRPGSIRRLLTDEELAEIELKQSYQDDIEAESSANRDA